MDLELNAHFLKTPRALHPPSAEVPGTRCGPHGADPYPVPTPCCVPHRNKVVWSQEPSELEELTAIHSSQMRRH